MAIWSQREAAALAFAAAAAVKKAGGHPEAGNAYQCHPQLLPASSLKNSTTSLIPANPFPLPQVLAGSCAPPFKANVTGSLRGCQIPIVLSTSPAFLWLLKGNA